MKHDFETSVDRRDTGSLKWNKYKGRDVLPMWVADMDFVSAPEIIQALQERAAHGVFGYTVPYDEVISEVIAYVERRHGWKIDPSWLVWLPGLVQGLNLVCRAYGKPGDAVMVNTPVYPPFLSAPVFSDRRRVTVPLMKRDGVWRMDFEAMDRAVTPDTRVFILCNPHNPVGAVFSREDLARLVAFCDHHNLVLCSDEIHCDLIIDDVPHVCTATLGPVAASRTVTFLSPSKTYNLPGLACAYAIIPNPELRAAFQRAARGIITEVNAFGYAGCAAAYRHGEPWRQGLLDVLRANRDRLYAWLAKNAPEIPMTPMRATYLAWLDVRSLLLEHPQAHFEAHGLGLSPGGDFGDAAYLRLNFGCPPSVLEEGLARLGRGIEAARDSRG